MWWFISLISSILRICSILTRFFRYLPKNKWCVVQRMTWSLKWSISTSSTIREYFIKEITTMSIITLLQKYVLLHFFWLRYSKTISEYRGKRRNLLMTTTKRRYQYLCYDLVPTSRHFRPTLFNFPYIMCVFSLPNPEVISNNLSWNIKRCFVSEYYFLKKFLFITDMVKNDSKFPMNHSIIRFWIVNQSAIYIQSVWIVLDQLSTWKFCLANTYLIAETFSVLKLGHPHLIYSKLNHILIDFRPVKR